MTPDRDAPRWLGPSGFTTFSTRLSHHLHDPTTTERPAARAEAPLPSLVAPVPEVGPSKRTHCDRRQGSEGRRDTGNDQRREALQATGSEREEHRAGDRRRPHPASREGQNRVRTPSAGAAAEAPTTQDRVEPATSNTSGNPTAITRRGRSIAERLTETVAVAWQRCGNLRRLRKDPAPPASKRARCRHEDDPDTYRGNHAGDPAAKSEQRSRGRTHQVMPPRGSDRRGCARCSRSR